ncbi:hypothetical protein HMPREF1872_00029 [Amygdalobacter nucleatus]|uniref:Uncharacterized protein n=1 Tax=Amygdalobacter nucleatus TaxID=3029274 RepID=A0A133YHM5_9FIRM|nr:hypothetical protein HMPREF1872_00029 [Amygdalobacter nucleatus]
MPNIHISYSFSGFANLAHAKSTTRLVLCPHFSTSQAQHNVNKA